MPAMLALVATVSRCTWWNNAHNAPAKPRPTQASQRRGASPPRVPPAVQPRAGEPMTRPTGSSGGDETAVVGPGAHRTPATPAIPASRIARPHDPPTIYDVSVTPSNVGAGDVVYGTVRTSSNVASVVATVAGQSAGLPKVGVGQFAMSYKIPSFVPPFVKGTYTIVVVARNVDGASTSRSIAITLH